MASAPPTSQLHAHEEPQHEQQQADDQAPFDLLSLISRAGTTQASIWRHLDARSKLAMWCACTATRDMVQACAHELTLRLGKGGSEAQQAQLLAPGLTRRVAPVKLSFMGFTGGANAAATKAACTAHLAAILSHLPPSEGPVCLRLQGLLLGGDLAASLLVAFPTLSSLYLRSVDVAGASFFQGLPPHTSLTALSLSWVTWADASAQASLASIAQLPALTSLSLSGMQAQSTDLAFLGSAALCGGLDRTLTRLDLGTSTSEHRAPFARLARSVSQLRALQHLSAESCEAMGRFVLPPQAVADLAAACPDLRSLDLRGATLSPEGLPHLLKLSALTTLALHYIEAVAAQDIARVADAARDGARATADPGVGSGGGHAREEAAAGEGAAGPAPGPRQEADVAPAGAGTSASPGTPGHAGGAPAAGSGSSSCFTDAGTGRDTRSLGPVARALRERRQRLPAPALRSLTLGSAATWGLDCLDAAALPLHTLTEPFEVNALCFSWLAPRTPFLSLEVAVEALEEAALNLGSACPGLALPRGKLALHFPYGITYPRAFDCAQLLSVLGPLAPHLRALELLRPPRLSQASAEALGKALGAQLQRLVLTETQPDPCFWPALGRCLPALTTLQLSNVPFKPEHLGALCRSALQQRLVVALAGALQRKAGPALKQAMQEAGTPPGGGEVVLQF